MKKRGFGMNKFNGFGGKIEAQETIEQGAQRELQEEAGITAQDLYKVAEIEFTFDEKIDARILHVHVFKATQYTGVIAETEEMKPQWFPIDQIPYKQMWIDDVYWLPWMLEDRKFVAHFQFSDYDTLVSHKMEQVSKWY